MSRYRGGPKPWDKADHLGRKLDSRQFPELNATFYSARPADFINMWVNVVSLMASSDELLAPAFRAERRIADVLFRGIDPPGGEERERYLQMEALMIVHHASQ